MVRIGGDLHASSVRGKTENDLRISDSYGIGKLDNRTDSHALGAGMEKKELNNEHSAGGIPPAPKSRSKRKPADEARRYRSRLNDAVTPVAEWKRPNAQKHGVFSVCPTIPGEDPREFQELLSALIDEWQPSGPTEQDAVFSLADLMWRKRRAQKFIQAKLTANSCHRDSPTFIEAHGLALFVCFMATATEPETTFERCANNLLSADRIRHLRGKFPRSNFQSTTEWVNAVLMEIKSVTEPKPEANLNNVTETLNKLTTEWLVANTMNHAREFFDHELNLRERLDAMIARQVKHLLQTKATKQMLRQTSDARDEEQPKRIAARSGLS